MRSDRKFFILLGNLVSGAAVALTSSVCMGLPATGLLELPRSASPGRSVEGRERFGKIASAAIVHLARFTTWPEASLPASHKDILICGLGSDEVTAALPAAVEGKEIDGSAVSFQELSFREATEEFSTHCHLLYLAATTSPALLEPYLKGKSENSIAEGHLTVTASPELYEKGAMVLITVSSNRMNLRIHQSMLQSAKLKISSDVLDLATLD